MEEIYEAHINNLIEQDDQITGALLVDNHGLALQSKNVDKTVAASTKGLIDAAKSLKIEGQETSKNYPVVVIETDTTAFVSQEKNGYILTVQRKNESTTEAE
mmetsp:Transcript_6818/g.6115  ORF Transcript_6818/g.6115 Transcript_6818/m.6115 type:complete len:102 (+) Transcript_6818:58-363(+)|eukprot:CAMPEP_0114589436 /NCGR_PEP_ID=MMETSP0125-20121206/11879_1 /TAXON_ID=485358 ORGANISM="Aristerostoma sp., Strain ATCC 50986" /NCGR_SAMPLE_ID=MMETSP0125 /ASSEMBLY_ACC=CAM_ASM_000245 /LENGTH=101 /DNA_ID=CAMNT_0001786311 /DNA_START=58 /DNA_END=363 /DNA_ORIENTATION=+